MSKVRKNVHVSSHYRSTPSGGRTHVKSYTRRQRINRSFDSSNSSSANSEPRETKEIEAGSRHYPGIKYSGKTTGKWNEPDLEEFGYGSNWDQMTEKQQKEVAEHYLVNTDNKYPPEDFSDLKLPVVEPDGDLSKHAVDNADARLNQTHGLSDEQREGIQKEINRIQHFEFEE